MPDGFVVHAFAGDDPLVCRDHVRKKLGLPEWKPKEKTSGKSKGSAKPYSPVVTRYVYRQADGTPYLQVCRTQAKTFFQNRWNGQMWVSGKPDGPKVPYHLPELLVAPLTTPIHICEGERDADALRKLGFVATTNSEGAANWTDNLNEHFQGRTVFVHEDNDDDGRKRCQRIARALDPITKSVRIIRLPGLKEHGDVSDWLEGDPSGARLVKHCESAPVWEPTAEPPLEEDKASEDDDSTGDDGGGLLVKMKKQADILIELASTAELFHDQDDVGYARFDVNGHKENWPIRSKGFKRWLVRAYYNDTQGAPSSEAVSTALGVLEARAQFDAPEHDVRIRVASHNGAVYIDLADKDWRAIEIDEDGWRIIDEPPVYFRRSSGMKALPEPVAGGSLDDDLRPLLNVKTDADFVLAVAWLLAALHPSGPYPMLGFAGEQGSAKSMRTNFLRALVDPNSVPLRTLPRSEHDLFIAAHHSHVLAYDNVSGLPDWLSDAFCRLSTGGGFSVRELYTDQDEVLFGGKRPVLLNGIIDIATRSDLADRTIASTLGAISDKQRKLEKQLWRDFEAKCPRILGALLDAVSHGLKTLPNVKLDSLPRMADFAVWVTACEGALWKPGTFMAAYTTNIQEAVEVVLDADQVATELRSYMDLHTEFKGSASDLLKALNEITPDAQQKDKGWPKRSNTLSGILRRIAPPLRKIGIDITFARDKRQKTITITRPDRTGKTSSPSSPSSLSKNINGLDGTGDRHRIVNAGQGIVPGDDPGDDPQDGIVTANPLKGNGSDDPCVRDDLLHALSGSYVVLGLAPARECCTVCGKGGAVERIKHTGGVSLWHRGCAERYFAALKDPPVHVPPDDGGEDRSCRHCNGPLNGNEQLCAMPDGSSAWLHPECQRPHLDRVHR